MKINVHAGHNAHTPGASSLISELTEDRKVKDKVIAYLKNQGHTVYDCTDDSGTTQSANLSNIVKKCNAHDVDLDVSIHFNAGAKDTKGNGNTTGVEAYIYSSSSKAKTYATNVCKYVAALGFKNRGVKTSTSLYVLKHTDAPAMLIECCFADDKDDVALYDYEKMAKAIVQGITGKAVTTSSSSSSSEFYIKVANVSKGDVLNIRKSASASAEITGTLAYNDPNTYTITETKTVGNNKWGKLKSGIGWINLAYTKTVTK